MNPGTSRRIRILLVTQTLDRGGLEEAVLATAAGLDRSLFEVFVAYYVGGEVARRLAALPAVTAVPIAAQGRWARFAALVAVVRGIRPAILHNHFCRYGLPAGVLGGSRRVETVHNQYGWLTPLQRAEYNTTARLAHRLISVSESVRAYTVRRFPSTARRRWEVIPNGIDPDRFRRTDAASLRTALGVDPSAVVAGFSGRLETEKGAGILLDAAAILLGKSPQVTVVIAGTGSREQELQNTVRERGLANVRFAGYRSDIDRLYSAFDLLVMPSAYEGLPLALLEAMAAGCPVAAFPVGGITEAVTDGVEGVFARPGSAEDLAAVIARLAADPGLRRRMAEAAVRRVTDNYSVSSMIARLQKVYGELVAESGA